MFENDVKMYGIQTRTKIQSTEEQFENDVKMYGIQTKGVPCKFPFVFENDVKMYGIQTKKSDTCLDLSLRMM